MHFEVHGRTEPEAPTILLSSGLGGSGAYWTPQIEALSGHFRVVTYDHRGTGRTGGEVPLDGGISAMADDVLEIVSALNLQKFHFMGHALGGLIGLDIALRRPGLIDRLVLINAWSKADPHSGRCFDVRIELLEKSGVEAFVKAQPLFLYPAAWMSENQERLARDDAHGVAHFQGKENVLRRITALRAFDVDARLGEIGNPVLGGGDEGRYSGALYPLVASCRRFAAKRALPSRFRGSRGQYHRTRPFNARLLRFLLPVDQTF